MYGKAFMTLKNKIKKRMTFVNGNSSTQHFYICTFDNFCLLQQETRLEAMADYDDLQYISNVSYQNLLQVQSSFYYRSTVYMLMILLPQRKNTLTKIKACFTVMSLSTSTV